MAYDARAVANYFLDKAWQERLRLNHIKLQKLVYIAHGWHLALIETPLIYNSIEAWEYGPIIPTLYDELEAYNTRNVTSKISYYDPIAESDKNYSLDDYAESEEELETTQGLLDRVWEVHKNSSSLKLSAMTNHNNTPWAKALHSNKGVPGALIDDEIMLKSYQELANRVTTHA